MAMMMTGRVLLVCALCVLWCGAVFGVAADDAGDGDGSAGEYLLVRWRAQLRRECAEEVGRRSGGRANASAVEECVRQRMESLHAVVDNRHRWGREQFEVVAAEDEEKVNPHESSPKTQTGSVAQLPDGQSLEPSPNSVPGSAVTTTGKGKPKSSARPPGAPGEGSEGLTKKERVDEVKKEESDEEEDEEDEVTVIDEDAEDHAGIGTSNGSQEQEQQKAGTGQGASGGNGKENGHVVAGSKLTGGSAASPSVLSVDFDGHKSLELTHGDVGGKDQTGETTVQEPPAVKVAENKAAELISTENTAEATKQKTEGKAEAAAKEEAAADEKTATFKSISMNNMTKSGDSDSSTAVSHTTSPLLLLVFVVCAAAAAVVAA
ncbi:mucin-associated surface protein (MASP) [Trypanosoma cruzi Dm28c]|uniref:Mucin-associated surface protein (MASP) n=2 Tax=Trypanosoma cruzi TaxID=5693 RepID=V5APJ0_TRYCR|nr:mucin-associated surface protein (MASP) [Trypanosoma cruzi Dm28c]PBJ77772.1 mucin-associated surface protein [Trypanosoma cruzi cruzi]PWU93075.1 Mucin-associated surface protein (MASP) [Trypanosoma cruzi]